MAAVLGVVVAASELVSRYRDDPLSATTSRAGVVYLLFNAAVSCGVFYLIRDVIPQFRDPPAAGQEFARVISDAFIAGASAMAVLRTSFMTVHFDGKDVPIGLAAVVDVFRTAIDRDVDRIRAGPRAIEVAAAMKDVSFEPASMTLTSMAMSMMQNVSADERNRVEQRVAALANQTDRNDESKAQELGLILANTIGFKNLQTIVTHSGDSIKTASTRSRLVESAVDRLDTKVVLNELPITCLLMSRGIAPETQEAFKEQLKDLQSQAALTDRVKAINTALLCAHFVGEDSFVSAVDLLDETSPSTSTS